MENKKTLNNPKNRDYTKTTEEIISIIKSEMSFKFEICEYGFDIKFISNNRLNGVHDNINYNITSPYTDQKIDMIEIKFFLNLNEKIEIYMCILPHMVIESYLKIFKDHERVNKQLLNIMSSL